MSERGFFRRWGLVLPAVLAPAAELLLLAALGVGEARSLAAQVTAPAPLDLFHDLRWVSVYHNSWPILVLEIAGVLFLRSLWVAWVVQRSWPDDRPPPMWAGAWRAGTYLVVASALLLPFVALLFGLALTHISFLFFAALPPVLAIALAIHTGAASQAAGRWWRWRPTAAGLAWVLAAFVWLTVAGAAIRSLPLPAAAVVAGAAGLANARAWYGIVQSVVRRPERRRVPALVPALLTAIFAVVLGGSAIGFAVVTEETGRPLGPAPFPEAGPGKRPVLVAAGLYSRFDPRPPLHLPRGHEAWRFSYQGLDDRGRPRSYDAADTLQPVMVSARKMAEQVDRLYRAYREPVTVVAESEGALVARAYLNQIPGADRRVDRLVTLEMHPGVAGVYLPELGRQGWGVGTGWLLRGVAGVVDEMAPFPATVDTPLMRDMVDCRRMLDRVVAAPLPPAIEELSVGALADWVDRPFGAVLPLRIVNAPHTGLIERPGVQATITGFLLGAELPPPMSTSHVASLISAASSPWRVPDLDGELFPADGCPS